MEQKIVLEKPTMEAKTILELPKGDMVKAITLLPQNEQKIVAGRCAKGSFKEEKHGTKNCFRKAYDGSQNYFGAS